MWSGKLFSPRGLSGLHKLLRNELEEKCIGKRLRMNREYFIEGIEPLDLQSMTCLRVPQSIWVPLIESPVQSVDDAIGKLREVDWSLIPSLKSHGPRITVSRDNLVIGKSEKLQIFDAFRTFIQSQINTEFSIRLDHASQLSLSVNVIPPRPWIDSPSLMSFEERLDWRPSEQAIRTFRNESSLQCLCASFLRVTPFHEWARNAKEGDLVVWDPFAGNGAVLMEMLLSLLDSDCKFQRNVTIVANTKSLLSLDAISDKIHRLKAAFPNAIALDIPTSDAEETGIRKRGRKSKVTTKNPEIVPEEFNEKKIRSISLRIYSTVVAIHITTVPFEDTFPYVAGGLILSHIPKAYNELTGIDKHDLSEWTAFGSLIKTRSTDLDAFFFTETNSFAKYSKLKFSRMCHLVSPNGKSIGHFSKWLGI